MKMNNVKYGDITVAWHKTTQNLKNGNLLDEVLTLKLGIYETAKFLQINAINWNGDEIQLRGVGYIVYPYDEAKLEIITEAKLQILKLHIISKLERLFVKNSKNLNLFFLSKSQKKNSIRKIFRHF
ncbi:MAG: hypothetical protein WAV68_01175 [Candidatus Nanogingivalis sp.]